MTSSNRPVGRVNYVLRTLLVTAMAFALEFLGDELLHLTLLPRYLYALQRVLVFALVGSFSVSTIDGRLRDIGLPRWYRYPAFAVWLTSTSLSAIWPDGWLFGLALFALLLIAGCSVPGKATQVPRALAIKMAVDDKEESASANTKKHLQKFPSRLLVNPLGFLRSLVTITCLWIPLIWLENGSGQGAVVWIARSGFAILSVAWLFKMFGRLADAGRLPRVRYGYLAIGLVLLIRILPVSIARRLSQWPGLPFLNAVFVGLDLTWWFSRLNGYEILALFLLVQIPLALLPSQLRKAEHIAEDISTKGNSQRRGSAPRTNELSLSGPLEYLRILLVITSIWIPLIYMDRNSASSVGTWAARAGFVILGCFWLVFANGRLEDAGWGHSLYPSQYFLVVSVTSLMPLAVHLVNGYGALAIFVLVQIPIIFLKSKPTPEELPS